MRAGADDWAIWAAAVGADGYGRFWLRRGDIRMMVRANRYALAAPPTLTVESWPGPGGPAVAGYRVCRIRLMDWVLPAAVVPHKARAALASLGGACSSDGGLVEKVERAGRALRRRRRTAMPGRRLKRRNRQHPRPPIQRDRPSGEGRCGGPKVRHTQCLHHLVQMCHAFWRLLALNCCAAVPMSDRGERKRKKWQELAVKRLWGKRSRASPVVVNCAARDSIYRGGGSWAAPRPSRFNQARLESCQAAGPAVPSVGCLPTGGQA